MRHMFITALNGTGGSVLSATLFSSGQTLYTQGVNTVRGVGYASLVLSMSGHFSVGFQVAMDNSSWVTPTDENAVDLSVIGSSLTGTNKFIQFTPVLAPWTRLFFTAHSNSTVTPVLGIQI
jgi:hypothetical protein